MATVPQLQAMRATAGKGQKEIYNFIDSLMGIWNEGALCQLCFSASQLNINHQLEAKLKLNIFQFVTRRRKYLYLGYLKYKLAHREKDIMPKNNYFSELRKEEINDVARSRSFFSKLLSSITPKKRKLKEQWLPGLLSEIPKIQQKISLANLKEHVLDQIYDWASITVQKQAEDLLKIFTIETQEESKPQVFEETSQILNTQASHDHIL